jgi:hypothetical protein
MTKPGHRHASAGNAIAMAAIAVNGVQIVRKNRLT